MRGTGNAPPERPSPAGNTPRRQSVTTRCACRRRSATTTARWSVAPAASPGLRNLDSCCSSATTTVQDQGDGGLGRGPPADAIGQRARSKDGRAEAPRRGTAPPGGQDQRRYGRRRTRRTESDQDGAARHNPDEDVETAHSRRDAERHSRPCCWRTPRQQHAVARPCRLETGQTARARPRWAGPGGERIRSRAAAAGASRRAAGSAQGPRRRTARGGRRRRAPPPLPGWAGRRRQPCALPRPPGPSFLRGRTEISTGLPSKPNSSRSLRSTNRW